MRLREALYGCLVLALGAAGLLVDLQGEGSATAAGTRAARPSPRFIERAVFCPRMERGRPTKMERERPKSMERPEEGRRGGRAGRRALSVHVPQGVEAVARPWIRRPTSVEGRALWLDGAERRAVNVVGVGGRLAASSAMGWGGARRENRSRKAFSGGAGASGCSPVSSDRWYFPAGASSVGWDERISIANPFPDEAVVRVAFAPGRGTEAREPHEVAVPGRSSVEVEVNRLALPDPSLAATVTVLRGRVAAWKTVFHSPEVERSSALFARLPGRRRPRTAPGGAAFSLGADSPSGRWYFPEAGAGKKRITTLALLNPATRPASVTISLLGRRAIAQPPDLRDVAVPAGGSTALTLEAPFARRGRVRSFGAVVTSTGGERLIAERFMGYRTPTIEGIASEVGAPRPVRRWSLAPAAPRPLEDDVVVLNPGGRDAIVNLTLLRPSHRAVSSRRLRGLEVKEGSRRTIAVPSGRGGPASVVVLRSSEPVVAERRAYSRAYGDVSSVMGTPFPLGRDGPSPG